MQKAGYLYQPNLQEKMKDWIGLPYTFYDAFNPGARQMFWSQIDTEPVPAGASTPGGWTPPSPI